MDEKPLRQEDYQAMAEELRRLRAQVEKSKKPVITARQKVKGQSWWDRNNALLAGILGITTVILAPTLLIRDCIKEEAKPNCFRTSQGEYARPFDPWHVVKIPGSRYEDQYLGWECWTRQHDCPGFKTRREAEEFITTWKLAVCK